MADAGAAAEPAPPEPADTAAPDAPAEAAPSQASDEAPPASASDEAPPAGDDAAPQRREAPVLEGTVLSPSEEAEAAPDMEKAPEEEAEDGSSNAKWTVFSVKETQRECKALFVPDGRRLNTQDLQVLLAENWNDETPNFLVSADAGTIHPKDFATPALRDQVHAFEKFRRWGELHGELRGIEKGSKKMEDFSLKVINDVIFLRLTTVFVSVLEQAVIAPNFIVVDRVSAKSPSAELILEIALQKVRDLPKVLCIDAFSRLKQFKGQSGTGPIDPVTQTCIDTMRRIQKTGVNLGSDDEPKDKEDIMQFYDLAEYSDPYADFFMNSPLPRKPEAVHVQADGTVQRRSKWQYHYLKTFWGGANRYILLDVAHDAPDLSGLGEYGFIHANGQDMMFDRFKSRVQQGYKMVMLHNTGGLTQAFAAIRAAMLSQVTCPTPNEILNLIKNDATVSNNAWRHKFGLPEIHMMMELNQRAPMILRDTILAVDVMNDPSDRVLDTMAVVFNAGGGVPELGLGMAEQLCILTAWKRHLTLYENAIKFEQIADAIQLFTYCNAILTTVLAVLYALETASSDLAAALAALTPVLDTIQNGELSSGALDGVVEGAVTEEVNPLKGLTALEMTMVLLPIISALLNAIRSKMRPREKWATCYMAAFQIVNQIYDYRLRTNAYDPTPPPPKEGEEPPPEISPKKRAVMMRQLFVETCKAIYTAAISTEVAKGGSLQMGQKGGMDLENDKASFIEALNEHNQIVILGVSKSKKPKKSKVTPAPPEEEEPDYDENAVQEKISKKVDKKRAKDEEGPSSMYVDNLYSQLDVESYMHCRLRPLTAFFERRAPTLSNRATYMEGVAIAANTVGALLAVTGGAEFIAISVAVASVAMALQDYFYLPSQTNIANSVLSECHNLILHWDSLSLVQRKTRRTRSLVCTTCEQSYLSLVSARTAISAKLPTEDKKAEEGEDN
jgi:hypothetical protein